MIHIAFLILYRKIVQQREVSSRITNIFTPMLWDSLNSYVSKIKIEIEVSKEKRSREWDDVEKKLIK